MKRILLIVSVIFFTAFLISLFTSITFKEEI
jgi:hypothetical protein